MWKVVNIGMTRAEALAALRAIGIMADAVDTSDGFVVTEDINFTLEGFAIRIELDCRAGPRGCPLARAMMRHGRRPRRRA